MLNRAGLAFSGLLVMVFSTAADQPADKVMSWEKDVRPAVEAAFCVASAEANGTTHFWPEVNGGEKCPTPNVDPTLGAITEAVTQANSGLQWLFIAIFDKIQPLRQPADPARREEVELAFRKAVIGDARLMRRYMPAIHAVLSESGTICSDCPGPSSAPAPRSVTVEALMPYAVALVWPDRIKGPMSVSLHICSGANGLSRIADADLDLADAAFSGVFGNRKLMPSIQEHLSVPERYPDAKTDEEKLTAIRRDLHKGLVSDPRFRSAFAAQLLEKRQELNVICSDCEKVAADKPPAATTTK
jgi:hypothetical protein